MIFSIHVTLQPNLPFWGHGAPLNTQVLSWTITTGFTSFAGKKQKGQSKITPAWLGQAQQTEGY